MRIVAENSEADLARERATEEVRWALQDMAANLLRVVRGAGRPHEVGLQAGRLIEALAAYREVAGMFPHAYDLTRFLSVNRDEEMLARCSKDERARAYEEERVVRGALQVAASRLAGQKTQEAAGHHEML
jgi:hypothetical protein